MLGQVLGLVWLGLTRGFGLVRLGWVLGFGLVRPSCVVV